jgi:hypothetical protein
MFEEDPPNPFVCYLSIEGETPLEHLKTGEHAHEALMFAPGVYKIRRQFETTPEGWKRAVAD